MKTRHHVRTWLTDLRQQRRGVFVALAAIVLVACVGFVAFSVDTGLAVMTKSQMQNAADAAAMSATNEISRVLANGGTATAATTAARTKAQSIAQLNGMYIDPVNDVQFGNWSVNPTTGQGSITWGGTPANAVKVTVRKDNANTSAADGQLKTLFAGAFGRKSVALSTVATSYIQSRDIAIVMDLNNTQSQNSTFGAVVSPTELTTNMQNIHDQLAVDNDLGCLPFTPQYFEHEVTNAGCHGKTKFKGSSCDINMDQNMTQMTVTYDDNTSETVSCSGKTKTHSCASTKNIKKCVISCAGSLARSNCSKTSYGKTCNTTYYNSESSQVNVSCSHHVKKVRVYYDDGDDDEYEFYPSLTKTINCQNKYVKRVKVEYYYGGSSMDTDNPCGSTRPAAYNSGTVTFEESDANIKKWLCVDTKPTPWKDPDGTAGDWSDLISHCRNDNDVKDAGHCRKYGGQCMVDYVLKNRYTHDQCPSLCKTKCYPLESCKQGTKQFCNKLSELSCGDEIGLVSCDSNSRRETTCTENGKNINLTSNPICSNHTAVADLCDAKQSGHYGTGCNPCGGIKCAQQMLTDSARSDCQKTIVVVSCSTPTCKDSTVSVPAGWDWNKECDYDHDGVADYSTTDVNKACAVVQAKEAAKSGCTVHTISVGNQCDTSLMKAIAHVGCGKAQTVPQNSDPVVMNTNVQNCFQKVSTATPSCKTKCQ